MVSGVASALAGGAASAGIGFGLNKAFGGGGVPRVRTTNIQAGGFRTKGNETKQVTSTPERLGLVNNVRSLFEEQAGEFGNLRSLVRPGFGALTRSRVDTLENRGAQRLSNLRSNLSRRRVAGSSFGQGQLQSEARQLDHDISEVRAQSFLQELDLTIQLLEKETASDIAGVQTVLSNMDLEANVGLQLATGAQAALTANTNLLAQAAIANAQGIAKPFAGVGPAVEKGVKGLFD